MLIIYNIELSTQIRLLYRDHTSRHQYPSHGPNGTLWSAGRILPGTHVTAKGEPRGPYPTHMNKALALALSSPHPYPLIKWFILFNKGNCKLREEKLSFCSTTACKCQKNWLVNGHAWIFFKWIYLNSLVVDFNGS